MRNRLLVLIFCTTAIGYSILRATEWSTWIKPVPILCCLLLLLLSKPAYPSSTRLITAGLIISILGDIALDLQATTIGIGLFSLVMLIYGWALFLIYRSLALIPLVTCVVVFGGIYALMFPHLGQRQVSGLIYQVILCWMVWRGASLLRASKAEIKLNRNSAWLIFLGTLGIATNGILYGIDMYLYPIPRDMVIHSYYIGQLSLVSGFISATK